MKPTINIISIALMIIFFNLTLYAQNQKYNLNQIIQYTLENNSMLMIQREVVEEKQSKIKETQIKLYPSIILNADYIHNFKIGQLSLPAGSIGFIEPNTLIPNININFPLGEKNNYTTGISIYQPITQLNKIITAVKIDKVDQTIAKLQVEKLTKKITLDIKILYYSILAVRKRIDAAEKKNEVAQIQLYDLQSAINSGKTIQLSEFGLKANILKEQQDLLKLKIKEKDLLSDLQILSGVETSSIILEESNTDNLHRFENLQSLKDSEVNNNFDFQISSLEKEKLTLAIKATNESFLPDLGFIAGYNYQKGNSLFPETNPYIGINFRWNIQDVFITSYQLKQKKSQYEQLKENNQFTKKQIFSEINKSYRKLIQSKDLVDLAKMTLDFRINDFELEKNKKRAGLNLPIDVLKSEFMLTEAKADYYEAKLNYIINLEEINNLTNN